MQAPLFYDMCIHNDFLFLKHLSDMVTNQVWVYFPYSRTIDWHAHFMSLLDIA